MTRWNPWRFFSFRDFLCWKKAPEAAYDVKTDKCLAAKAAAFAAVDVSVALVVVIHPAAAALTSPLFWSI